MSSYKDICVELKTKSLSLFLTHHEEMDMGEAVTLHNFKLCWEVFKTPDRENWSLDAHFVLDSYEKGV
jgi:hypothetical protein